MKITQYELAQFTGSEHFYRHWTRQLIYTDGCQYLSENGAAWLIDAIASYQPELKKNPRLQEFQLWEMKLNGKGGCVLTCREDTRIEPAVTQNIEYTDFPFDIKLYVEAGEAGLVCLLPSEH